MISAYPSAPDLKALSAVLKLIVVVSISLLFFNAHTRQIVIITIMMIMFTSSMLAKAIIYKNESLFYSSRSSNS